MRIFRGLRSEPDAEIEPFNIFEIGSSLRYARCSMPRAIFVVPALQTQPGQTEAEKPQPRNRSPLPDYRKKKLRKEMVIEKDT